MGGEEFAILAPDTDEHGAYILAERVRGAVELSSGRAGRGGVTASFGIASFPVHGQTAASLLQAGDQALYAAKRLGRNRTVISSAEVPGILARAPRGREEAHVELATLLSLAEALDVRDSGSATHCQRVGRYSELIARELGPAARLGRAGADRRDPPRRRPRGRAGRAAREGGPARRGGVALGALAPRDRRADAARPPTSATSASGSWPTTSARTAPATRTAATATEVPLEAAILGVADAYEAMTAARPYRPPLDPQAASDELRRGAGRQFDERVVDALLRVV